MAQIHESVANFLSALTSGLEALLPDGTIVWTSRAEETPGAGLVWWSCGLSVDPDCRFLAGAPDQTWEQFGGDTQDERFGKISQAILKAAQSRFGLEVSCTDPGPAEEPPATWTAVTLTITVGEQVLPDMEFVVNPAFEAALGADPEVVTDTQAQPRTRASAAPQAIAEPNLSAVDMLLHVEIPVSVLLGRAQMHMKDLLALSHGSIVELQQELNDEVEIRVSNCTIARGEVVAVDGNYGVRILEMLPGAAAQNALTGGKRG